MKLLEDRIKRDGEVLDGDVLKINSFLNHQVDPKLMMQVGEEFKRLFADEKIDKILTCEASGIAPGIMTAYQLGVPMVFARKKKPSTLNDAVYWQMSSHTPRKLPTRSVLKKNSYTKVNTF